MALPLLPDAELVVARYLRAHSEVALRVGMRVYTELPPDPVWPLVRLVRIGGVAEENGYIDRARIQVDAWAASKFEARIVAATVQAALFAAPGSVVSGAVFGEVVNDLGVTWSPDPATGQPRYLFGVRVLLHPSV